MAKTISINAEIRRIEQQIKTLQARRAVLLKGKPVDWLIQNALPGERVNGRNFDKLVVLAHITNFLKLKKHLSGATTKVISGHLKDGLGIEVNGATLRSYLSRFKQEGRLIYDQINRVWLLPAQSK